MRRSLVSFVLVVLAIACGEVRRPIGDECLRGDDCLSGVCSARECVAAPALLGGTQPAPEEETPRIPVADGGVRDAAEGG